MDARNKRHSTVSEAGGIALQMKATALLLTHFSQRYPQYAGAATADAVAEEGGGGRGSGISGGGSGARSSFRDQVVVAEAHDHLSLKLGAVHQAMAGSGGSAGVSTHWLAESTRRMRSYYDALDEDKKEQSKEGEGGAVAQGPCHSMWAFDEA